MALGCVAKLSILADFLSADLGDEVEKARGEVGLREKRVAPMPGVLPQHWQMRCKLAVAVSVSVAAIEGVMRVAKRCGVVSFEVFAVTMQPGVELHEVRVVGGRVDVPEEGKGCILCAYKGVFAAHDEDVKLREQGIEVGLRNR